MKNLRSNGDSEELGKAMNEKHFLLSPVSTEEIEEVRGIAMENGAYGAKLTGAGGKGGAVIVLVPIEKEKSIINSIKKKGYRAFAAEISTQGPTVELVSK
jgi:mevalonate kinase